jgi:signal transduction histidine kinase
MMMLGLLSSLSGSGGDPGTARDVRWAWVTIGLSAAVALGYAVIAFNWYFQSKLAEQARARAALGRLCTLTVCCGACGFVFYASDMSWRAWRVYDVVLLLLAAHAWLFVLRTRGLSLVLERLARFDELERSARKFWQIAEFLPHMVWTATAEGRVDFSNRTWAEYAGDGRTWLDAVHPAERQPVLRWWADAVASREAATREVRLGGAAGYRTFLVTVTPVQRGGAVKWLGACADIEDQKRLAAEREAQARQKMFFLNALSHDLRAPLNNVTLNAHLVRMSARDPEEVEVADLIVANAVAAGDMVTNLLEFARLGAQEPSATESVVVSATLQQVVRRFQPLAEGKGLYLRVDLGGDGDPPADGADKLETDRLKLERVLGNLVDNAIKYTAAGGVTVRLATLGEGDGNGGGFAVRVCDSGIGIPEADIPHLFDEFYQVDNHERDRRKGFGMGLAICRTLARQLGGDVRLAETGPGGSCFEFVLRCAGNDGDGDGDGVRARGRGRQHGATDDFADPEPAGLCPA